MPLSPIEESFISCLSKDKVEMLQPRPDLLKELSQVLRRVWTEETSYTSTSLLSGIAFVFETENPTVTASICYDQATETREQLQCLFNKVVIKSMGLVQLKKA